MLRTLDRREARVREGLFLVEGRRLVDEALRSSAPVLELLTTAEFETNPAGRDLLRLAGEAGVSPDRISARDAGLLSSTRTPQGVFASVRLAERSPGDFPGDGLILALDGVSDPGNVGTLVRAADAFGASGVLGSRETAAFHGPKVLRAAMGSNFHLPTCRVEDLAGTLRDLKNAGRAVIAATLQGEDPRDRLSPGNACLILGGEARGVSPGLLAIADREVTIGCRGAAESLNVAMAGSILLYELLGGSRGDV